MPKGSLYDYLLTIVTEASTDGVDEFEGVKEGKDDKQIDQVPKTYVLLNNWWDVLEKNLPKNRSKLINFIGTYRSRNLEVLETPYPSKRLIWPPECNRMIYAVCGIPEKDFITDVETIRGYEGYIDKNLADKAPHILNLMIYRWFLLHGYTQEVEIMHYWIGYSYYWAVHYKYFRKFVNPDVMMYTIEEMSYKSRLKSLGSVDRWLAEGTQNTIATYTERIKRGSDYELHYIGEKIRGKFDSAMKTLFRAQEKNEKAGNRILISKDTISDGDEGEIDVRDEPMGVGLELSLAEKYASKFFAEPISEKCLKAAITPGGMSIKDLRATIISISDDPNNMNDVSRLYQSLFHLFLANTKYTQKEIGSIRFYSEMQKLYKPGNSNDPNKTFIKEVLDKWLEMSSKTFRTTNRTATILSFRKSVFDYFILKIMEDSN